MGKEEKIEPNRQIGREIEIKQPDKSATKVSFNYSL